MCISIFKKTETVNSPYIDLEKNPAKETSQHVEMKNCITNKNTVSKQKVM